jgi:basic membrane lipoprotein Med (substrate-binding protein (PBP1-ABC) superfamily)
VAVLAVAGIVTAALWPSSSSVYDPPARARQYLEFSACLLTGPSGLADSSAQAVWSGMENASDATRAKVTYLAAVGGAETVGSVTPFANTLVQQHCGLILAVGDVEVRTAQSIAAANTSTDFVLVGGGSSAGNIAVVPAGSAADTATRVASVVKAAVSGGFHAGVVS